MAKTHFILRKKERSISYSRTEEPKEAARETGAAPPALDAAPPAGAPRPAHSARARVCLTLHEVGVVGLVGREHGRHLVVVRRVDVLVNAVPGQFYL